MEKLDPRFTLRYNHPHVMTHIVDNSVTKKSEIVAEAKEPSMFGTLVVTGMPMGLDRQIYTQTSETVLKATTGLGVTTDSDRNVYGQSVDYALDVVRQQAPVRLLRVTPEDATYAFNVIFVEWKAGENSFDVRFNELKPEEMAALGFEFNRFTNQKNLNDQLVKAYANAYDSTGEWNKRVFITNIAQGRGSAYNDFFTVINSVTQGKNPADVVYDFHTVATKTNQIVESISSASLVDFDNSKETKHETVNKQVSKRTVGASIMIPTVNENAVKEVYDAYIKYLKSYYDTKERSIDIKNALELLTVNTFDIINGKALYKATAEMLPLYSIKSVSTEMPKLPASQITDVRSAEDPGKIVEESLRKVTYGVFKSSDTCYIGKIYLSDNKTSGIKLKLVAQINQALGTVTPVTITKVYPLTQSGGDYVVDKASLPVSIKAIYTGDDTSVLASKNLKTGDVVAKQGAQNAITLQMVTDASGTSITVVSYPENLVYEALYFDKSVYQNEYFARSSTYGAGENPGVGADKGFKCVGACVIGNSSETYSVTEKIVNGKAYVVTETTNGAIGTLKVTEVTGNPNYPAKIYLGDCPTAVPITADINNTQKDVREYADGDLQACVTAASVVSGDEDVENGQLFKFVLPDTIEMSARVLSGSGPYDGCIIKQFSAPSTGSIAVPIFTSGEGDEVYYQTNITGTISAETPTSITIGSDTYSISDLIGPFTVKNINVSTKTLIALMYDSENTDFAVETVVDGATVYIYNDADGYYAPGGLTITVEEDVIKINDTTYTQGDSTTGKFVHDGVKYSETIFKFNSVGGTSSISIVESDDGKPVYERFNINEFVSLDSSVKTLDTVRFEGDPQDNPPALDLKISISDNATVRQCTYKAKANAIPESITRFNIRGTNGSLYKFAKANVDVPNDYYTDTYGIKLDSESGGVKIIEDSGSTGFFDDYKNGKLDSVVFKWKYSALLVKAFRGGFDSRIRSTHQVSAAYLFDANFNTTYGVELTDDSSYTVKEIIESSSIFTPEEKEMILNNPEILESVIDVPEDIDVKQAMNDLAVERNYNGIPEGKRPVGYGSGFQVYFDVGTGDYEENLKVYESMSSRFDNTNFSCDIGWWEEGGFKYTYPKRIIESLFSFCDAAGNINKPFVLAATTISPDRYTSYSPAIEGNEWELKEEIYNKGANVWCIDSNNNLQRQFQHTFSSIDESSSMVQESNQRTLNVLVKTIERIVEKYIFQVDEDGVWKTAIDECNTKFVGWKGNIVKDYNIERRVMEAPDGTEISTLYVTVSFRNLILQIPVIVNIEK